VAPFYVETA